MAFYFFINSAPLAGGIYFLAQADNKKFTAAENILICITLSIAAKLFFLVTFKIFTGQNILMPDYKELSLVLNELYSNPKDAEFLFNQVIFIFPNLIPLLIITFSSIEAFLNYVLTSHIIHKYFKNANLKPVQLQKFADWKFSRTIVLTFIVALVIDLFIEPEEYPELYFFTVNLQLLADSILFIQGFAFLSYFSENHGFKNIFLRNFIFAVIIFIPVLWPLLIMLGMADISFNLRGK